MFDQKLSSYLLEQRNLCETRIRELSRDGREDEAVFEKIRLNVFDIFRSVLSAAGKAANSREGAIRFFLDRLQQIPESWRASLAAARAHGDVRKAHVEALKLETAEQIRQAARELLEGTV